MRLGSRITAAATTGPASGPRPASSTPATGKTPRFIAARSRRKLGRSGGSSSGRRGAFLGVDFLADLVAVRLMRRACCAGEHGNAMAASAAVPDVLVAREIRSALFCQNADAPRNPHSASLHAGYERATRPAVLAYSTH